MEHSGPAFLVFLQRQRISSARGTRRVSPPRGTTLFALPANPFYPRQPRASAYQAKAGSKRYGASRARSDPLYLNLPVLLGRRPAATRARTRAGDDLSSGRSGVIWSTAHAPGLAPSPGRSALRSAA